MRFKCTLLSAKTEPQKYIFRLSFSEHTIKSSFLYSPCFDLSTDTSAVVISFDLIHQITKMVQIAQG